MKRVAAVAMIAFATTVTCLATPPCTAASVAGCAKAPEIDMSVIGTASALIGCIVFMARGRRKIRQ
jgi:hypothetical protein